MIKTPLYTTYDKIVKSIILLIVPDFMQYIASFPFFYGDGEQSLQIL